MKNKMVRQRVAFALSAVMLVGVCIPANAFALDAEGKNYVHYIDSGNVFEGSFNVDPQLTTTGASVSIVMSTADVYFVNGSGVKSTTMDYVFTTTEDEDIPFKLDLSKVSKSETEIKVQVLLANHAPLEVSILTLETDGFSVIAPKRVKLARGGDSQTLSNIVVRGVVDPATVSIEAYDTRDLSLSSVGSKSSKGSDVIISGVSVYAEKNAADTGYVYIKADGEKNKIAVADIVEDEITVTVSESANFSDRDYKATIKFSAPSSSTFVAGRFVDVYLDGAEFKSNSDYTKDGISVDFDTKDKSEATISFDGTRKDYELEVEFVPERNVEKIYFNIEENKAGIEKTELYLGADTSNIEISVTKSEVKLGVRKQESPTIKLTEGQDGTFTVGKHRVYIDRGIDFENGAIVKVTDGNLDIDNDVKIGYDSNMSYIEFEVDQKSSKKSTVEIQGVTVTASNLAANGEYDIYLKLDSEDMPKVGVAYVTVVDSLTIDPVVPVKPVTPELPKTVFFKIGESNFYKDGAEMTMTNPAVIHNGRTMVPMKSFGDAIGAKVEWLEASRTVVVTFGDKTVLLPIDQAVMIVGSEIVPMDTKPLIVEGRTMLPAALVANMFGLTSTYDEALGLVKMVPTVEAIVTPINPTVVPVITNLGAIGAEIVVD